MEPQIPVISHSHVKSSDVKGIHRYLRRSALTTVHQNLVDEVGESVAGVVV